MKTCKVEGIIIKRTNLGEADRLLTVFTRQMGKIQVKAIGVRRIYSRRCPHTELLNHIFINLYQGKGLPIVTEIETFKNFSFIKKRLDKIGFAYYVCELIDRLCPYNQENADVFNLLEKTLAKFSGNAGSAVYKFEIDLLTSLGFYDSNKYGRDLSTQDLIENIIERKLKTRQILPIFSA